MDSEVLKATWRGTEIGEATVLGVDMWYMDCKWQPNSTAEAAAFTALASGLSYKEVMADPTKGTSISLHTAGEIPDLPTVLVMVLADGVLSVRRVLDRKAQEWLRANVK